MTGVLIAKQTMIESATYEVSTWYKFPILDHLTARASEPTAPRLEKLFDFSRPDNLLPIGENEIVIGKEGGSTVIGGVTVTVSETGVPDPLLNHTYLMFVSESADRLGIFEMGPSGMYELTGDQISSVGLRTIPSYGK